MRPAELVCTCYTTEAAPHIGRASDGTAHVMVQAITSRVSEQQRVRHLRVMNAHVCPQEPVRSIYFGTRATTGAASPTCHDFTAASDGLDLLVGLSNGEGVRIAARARWATKLPSLLHTSAKSQP